MLPFANVAGAVCVLFLIFFFPVVHGVARLICYLTTLTGRSLPNSERK